MIDGRPLSNTVGAVLDPIFSLRRRVGIAPGATARVMFSTLIAPSREIALDLADKYHDPATFERAATLAWTQAQIQLRHLRISTDEAHLFQRIANRILYSDPSLETIVRGSATQYPRPLGTLGSTASREISRLFWCGSMSRATEISCASCSMPMNTGA